MQHNLVYWHDQRYLSYGPGASGYWGNTRYKTVLAPANYIKRVRKRSVLDDGDHRLQGRRNGRVHDTRLRLNSGESRSEFFRGVLRRR